MSEIFVIPVMGARVHHPIETDRLIAPEGELVPRTRYILERLREGDLATPRTPSEIAATPKAKKGAVDNG